ncbi:MAG: hypothetical protein ILO10_02380 [Kiritimatiellae bacterium]|nr:hypothetical protein [Kiritimatiellia bacterium]
MRTAISIALLLAPLQAFGTEMAGVLSWTIPEGEVARVEVDGQTVWPSIPYVTNGLIAYWDGVWNAGLGRHDSSTMVWRDLSGNGFDATQRVATGWYWANDAYVGVTNNGHKFKPHYEFSRQFDAARTNHTVEIVSSASVKQAMATFGGYSMYRVNFEYFSQNGNLRFRWWYNATPDMNIPAPMSRASFAVCSTPSNTVFYSGGSLAGSAVANTYSKPTTLDTLFIGGEGSRDNMSMVGEICVIRVYNRALSPAEIAHNAAIDSLRFGIIQQLLTDQ